MKTLHFLATLLFLAAPMFCQAIEVRLSVKFIRNNDASGTHPSGDIGTEATFATEINRGNAVLAATGRGYELKVVEYRDIQPAAPIAAAVNFTGGTTQNSATVTCSNTAGLQVNMFVQGAGIPANSVIDSIVPNTSFALLSRATATNASVAMSASFPANFWFDLPARARRAFIEAAATATPQAKVTWMWNDNAINIYVNNSRSGSCAFVGEGLSIALGDNVGVGTVLHEIGHFLDLHHTHAGDYVIPTPTTFTLASLTNGDGLDETLEDNPDISTNDQLSNARFGVPYTQPPTPPNAPFATPSERAQVDSAFENVMSYHNENTLLSVQMDIWTLSANVGRLVFCNGRTWFVANGGNNGAAGNSAATPLSTLVSGMQHVTTSNDVVLLRNGTYTTPPVGIISTQCTLRATRGPVTIIQP